MPKMKTKKAVRKRIRITGKGKLKRAKANKSHLMRSKTSKRRLHLKKGGYVSSTEAAKVKKMLPYG
ncbi:MAG: 50S ribosomal protein L35 [Candidatus Omnitrophica bacterium]|nr:50S ribosomal protein L35 [Candidatus Omnitrophota bacterium]